MAFAITEILADAMDISQQSISNIEASGSVDEEKLKVIAEVLGVSTEAIKNFSEEAVFNYFNSFNSFNDDSEATFNNHCTFKPLDKLIEAYEENKKLYERLIQAEKDKNEIFRKIPKG